MARLNAALIALLAIAWTSCAAPLAAATHPVTVQFIPALPAAGQTVTARLSNGLSSACWPPATSTTQAGAQITLTLDFDDACSPQYLLPYRDYVLGAFGGGNYTLIVSSCSNNPPPFPSECHVVLRAGFAVIAPITPAPILSPWALSVLAVLVAAAAVLAPAFRRRRRN